MRPVCVICLVFVRDEDETRINACGGVMHAECDPEAIRCPHCDEVIDR